MRVTLLAGGTGGAKLARGFALLDAVELIVIANVADDAEIPGAWMCKNGQEGQLIDGPAAEVKKGKPPRTHWDMLLERRSLEELEELLKERMDLLKKRRRAGAR